MYYTVVTDCSVNNKIFHETFDENNQGINTQV